MEDDIDELFSSDPARFTAARDALAKRLRADGDSERAAQVKALRRPTTAAWAVNQVARLHSPLLDEVREAGRELERSQRRMLSGLRDAGMADATRRRREAVDAAVDAAADVLAAAGTSPDAHRDKVRATFEAASLGGDAYEVVRSGRLGKELPPPSGFGGLGGLELLTGDGPGGSDDGSAGPVLAAGDEGTGEGDDEAAGEGDDEAAGALARAALAQARERADEAVGRARAARRQAEELARSHDEAAAEAAALERSAQEARRRADDLATALEDAQEDERRLADIARRRAEDLRQAEERGERG